MRISLTVVASGCYANIETASGEYSEKIPDTTDVPQHLRMRAMELEDSIRRLQARVNRLYDAARLYEDTSF